MNKKLSVIYITCSIICFTLCFAILIFYTVLLFDTNPIVREAKEVMLGNVEYSSTEGTPLHRYNRNNILENAKVNVHIRRILVLHDFSDGYMWVKYTYETVRNDKNIYPGSSAISRWKIHKEYGKWEIVEIKEDP